MSAGAIAYERANGLIGVIATSLCGLAYLRMSRGRFSEAAAILDEAAPLIDASRSRGQRGYRLQVLAQLETFVGDHANAIAHATEHLNVAEESGNPGNIANSHWMLGFALLGAGNYESARTSLQRSVDMFEPTNRGQRPAAFAHQSHAQLGLGLITDARSSLDVAEATVLLWDAEAVVAVRTTSGLVAARLGDTSVADARFREAIDVISQTQYDVPTAEARLSFARFLMEQGRVAEAREQLETARSVFSDSLAFRRRDEIDALLRQCDSVRT